MENKSFKEKMDRLEEIVRILEENQVDLEKAIDLFEEGLVLSKECNNTLSKFDSKISDLIQKYEEQ